MYRQDNQRSDKMKFTKMHGIGNDYVYINGFEEEVMNPEELAIKVSDRHFGIGSDGLIIVRPSEKADCRMDMYNSDGTRSEMCGNGIRCVGKFVYDNGIVKKKELTVETLAGIKTLKLHIEEAADKAARVTVNMGEPVFAPARIPVLFEEEPVRNIPCMIQGREYRLTCVSMGNPHAVVFLNDIDGLDLREIGPGFECFKKFPNRINTEFIQVIDRRHLKMRVWERGSGETLACGTGACASLAAAVLNDLAEREAVVSLLGGDLHIFWNPQDNCVYMTGPAATVYTGEYLEETI